MSAHLQTLIDKIRTEAIEAASNEASRITAQAEEKAAKIIKEAEEKAAAILTQASEAAAKEVTRGKAALERAARDVLILLGDRTQKLMELWLTEELAAAVTPATLSEILAPALEKALSTGQVSLSVPEAQLKSFETVMKKRLSDAARKGLLLKADDSLRGGCIVKLVDQRVELDFSAEAMAEAIASLVHPSLAATVRAAAAGV
jgi:V/A-type H+-transporting ATPase subunit E